MAGFDTEAYRSMQVYPTSTEGHRPPAETPATASGPGRFQMVFDVITWVVLAVSMGVWAIVGFVFWIPLLVRSTVLFSIALVQATLAGRGAEEAGGILRGGVTFYRRGFEEAMGALLGERAPERRTERPSTGQPRRFVTELVWTAVIWYAIFLLLGIVEYGPADLWNQLTPVAWGDRIDAAFAAFWQWWDALL